MFCVSKIESVILRAALSRQIPAVFIVLRGVCAVGGSNCQQCPPGTWSTGGVDPCTPCDPGQVSPPGASDEAQCTLCPVVSNKQQAWLFAERKSYLILIAAGRTICTWRSGLWKAF
jgi:hypothetical protein